MPAIDWHYLQNQFLNSTDGSRKRMNIIVADHDGKLEARKDDHATLLSLFNTFRPLASGWAGVYSDWRNKRAEYRGATQTIENLFDELMSNGSGAQRSKVDEWDSRLKAHWSANDPVYATLLPQGRAPLTTGGRDSIIAELGSFATRLTQRRNQQSSAAGDLQASVDAITSGGGTPPEALLDQLEDAQDKLATLTTLATRVSAFHGSIIAARTGQQGIEGQVDAYSTVLEAKRQEVATELMGNLGLLIHHFRGNLPAVGAFFALDSLMELGPDEEPEPAPEPTLLAPVPIPALPAP